MRFIISLGGRRSYLSSNKAKKCLEALDTSRVVLGTAGLARPRGGRKESHTLPLSSATFLLQPPTKCYTPLLCFLPSQRPAITERRGEAPGHSWEPGASVSPPLFQAGHLCSKQGSPCWPVSSVSLIPLNTPSSLGRRAKNPSQ